MPLYSAYPLQRSRQLAADVVALALVVLFAVLGVTVSQLIGQAAEVGRQVEQAGATFEQRMTEAAEALGEVPLVGESVRAPFDGAGDAGAEVVAAGQGQQELIAWLAPTVGALVAFAPIAAVLVVWLPRRLRFVRRSRIAARLARMPEGVEVLAAKAVADASPAALLAAAPDVVRRWREGDPEAVRALAGVGLREAGLKPLS
ncbi:hypothetical protein [Desertivibrio insolitus]|uniref:hypothetical protein n=1 Tax=Herbiconiux sp. SYSU D00978 TaxID=2812562 RepID=UPI001A967031|nr:hypothetical protein [Herbiconiux sp. SYSU D00978]